MADFSLPAVDWLYWNVHPDAVFESAFDGSIDSGKSSIHPTSSDSVPSKSPHRHLPDLSTPTSNPPPLPRRTNRLTFITAASTTATTNDLYADKLGPSGASLAKLPSPPSHDTSLSPSNTIISRHSQPNDQPTPSQSLYNSSSSPFTDASPLSSIASHQSESLASSSSLCSASSSFIGKLNITTMPINPSMTMPELSVFAALTEVWRAHFYNGGGSSFLTAGSTSPPPVHFVTGDLSLAFPSALMRSGEAMATKDLVDSASVWLPELIIVLSSAERVRDLTAKHPGITIRQVLHAHYFVHAFIDMSL